MALNPKQAAFVREYLVDLNATQAAVRVGYSPRTAKVQGSRLLTNADIKAAVEAGQKTLTNEAEVSRARIIQELERIAYSDPAELLNDKGYYRTLNEMPESIRRCISSVELTGDGGMKIKLWSKEKCLELLGKHRAMWTEKTEVSGPDGGPLVVKVVTYGDGDA